MSSTSIPTVDLVAGRPVVSSLRVAEHFGKIHKNVIRDIRNVIASVSDDFNRLNFELVEYIDEKGETRPMYHLTRDGFTIVAMGYTGPKAMRMKEAYIRQFNEMERTLAHGATTPVALPALQPTAGWDTLRRLIHAWADLAAISRSQARFAVRLRCGVDRLDHLSPDQLPIAIAFVLEQIESLGDRLKLPAESPTASYRREMETTLHMLRNALESFHRGVAKTQGGAS
ncbi:phage regulatory protein [Nitratidesulfovibrio vulgaris]|uniref:Antirepressor, putative n=1 Tax=Nitratidesulfovibrio vulgaris (strain DP4) TaxID=391774 RepID=A0A0H3A6G7_NITV4|nr:phage regulatory protein [Nitratidesulfovibrio vulgaris]ABM28079.1 antirepressor, putative [Nitratidesulfovibrio vulgaris DP4]